QQGYLCSGDLNSWSASFGDDGGEELFILIAQRDDVGWSTAGALLRPL
ncbi:hypothetical protein SAMN02745225_02156, partial [Ferrithrix thermotolerans DSM 19514]